MQNISQHPRSPSTSAWETLYVQNSKHKEATMCVWRHYSPKRVSSCGGVNGSLLAGFVDHMGEHLTSNEHAISKRS